MAALIELIYTFSYGLLFYAFAETIHAVRRRGEAHRLAALAVISVIIVRPFLGRPQPLFLVGSQIVVLLQPFLLIRLVHHFRPVPRWLQTALAMVVPIGAVVTVVFRATFNHVARAPIDASIAVLVVYPAVEFIRQARRTTGVTRRRLVFAAVGTWAVVAINLFIAVAYTWPPMPTATVDWALIAVTNICYFFAFNAPRWLRARWQRIEQASFLSRAAERDPEERGRRAPHHLLAASVRSVGHTAAVVAMRADPSTPTFAGRVALPPALLDLEFTLGDRLIGRTVHEEAEASGPLAACEPDVAERLAPFGTHVLVAPIASPTRAWGVLIMVQRHPSLFLADELHLLGRFARHTATALDHAHLVVEARERERRVAARRLREIESRMSLMLDSIKDYAMFVVDHRGCVAAWQVGAQHVFGYTAPEMIDQSVTTVLDMAEQEVETLLNDARRAGRADREGTCRRRDGSRFLGATTVRPLEGEVDDPPGFVVVTRDVTEQRDLQMRLQQSQKMEAIGHLAGGVAHDFNNLLTAIVGNADWLDRKLNGEGREEIVEIQRAAERAAGLIRQLLAFSRQQVGRSAPVNLSRLVTDMAPLLRRLIGEHIAVVEETDPGLSAVMGDRNQLEQIVLNLSVNARDAMHAGGRLAIRTAMVEVDDSLAAGELLPGRHVLLEVSDSGVGMDAPTLARIYEPFFTTKEFGGTGLGLATVYGIVKQMAGAIRVDSEVGRGTKFRLYFPETRETEASRPVEANGEVLPGYETILVVEDHAAVRTFMQRTLETLGYRVLAATDPRSALEMAATSPEPIHLLITDVVLPGMTGTELARELAKIQPDVRVLYISGYADAVWEREGTRPKASHFLQKPFSAADLFKRINLILRES